MEALAAAFRIAWKDLKVEFRRSYEVLSILTFSLSSILICSFAWGGALTTSPEVSAAALWVILFFTSVLTFTTSFTREIDRGTLGGLKTLPCSPLSILLGKILYAAVLLLIVESVMLPLAFVFFNLKAPTGLIPMFLVFTLGTIDLSIVGSLISGLVMFSESKTLLLSFLLFPVCVPVLVPSVLATVKIMSSTLEVDVGPELRLLLACLLSTAAVATLTFRFLLEE